MNSDQKIVSFVGYVELFREAEAALKDGALLAQAKGDADARAFARHLRKMARRCREAAQKLPQDCQVVTLHYSRVYFTHQTLKRQVGAFPSDLPQPVYGASIPQPRPLGDGRGE